MAPDSWGNDWNALLTNNWYKYGDSIAGEYNEMEWNLEWKQDSDDYSKTGLFGELYVKPRDSTYDLVENDRAWINFDFNPSTASVEDYKPGNSVGITRESWGLSIDSTTAVELSLSQSQTQSDIEAVMIGDTIGPNDEDVSHKFKIAQESYVAENQCMVNAAALANTDPQSGETFANIDFTAKFENTWYNSHESLHNGYRYGWK